MRFFYSVLMILVFVIATENAFTQVIPDTIWHRTMSNQGFLADSSGNPVSGTVSLTFKYYSDSLGGSPLLTRSYSNIPLNNGVYSVQIPLLPDSSLPNNLFLETVINGQTQSPRLRVATVPFAVRSDVSGGVNIKNDFGQVLCEVKRDATSVSIEISDPGTGNTIKFAPPDTVFRLLTEGQEVMTARADATSATIEITDRATGNTVKFAPPDTVFRLITEGQTAMEANLDGKSGHLIMRSAIAGSDALKTENAVNNYVQYGPINKIYKAVKNAQTRLEATIDSSTGSGKILFNDGSGNAKVYVGENGIGIGTASPEGKLDVRGGSPVGVIIQGTANTNTNDIEIKRPGNASSSNIDFVLSERANNTELWLYGFDGSAYKNFIGMDYPNNRVSIPAGASSVCVDIANGRLGIGTSTPSEKLEVTGGIKFSGLTTSTGTALVVDANGKLYKQSSSIRYKQNIRKLETDVKKILELEPVRFQWKTTGQEDIGLIAEEVEKHANDLVLYDSDNKPEGVKYDRVALYLLGVVKEQQKQIQDLQSAVHSLSERLQSPTSDKSLGEATPPMQDNR